MYKLKDSNHGAVRRQARLVLAFLLCWALPALLCTTGSAAAAAAPSYAFVGKGFHMELEVAFPKGHSFYNISVTLPSDFFFDVAECEQQYRLMRVRAAYEAGARGTAASPPVDVAQWFSKLAVSTDYFFDIEAPVFKISYKENTAVFLFHRQRDAPSTIFGDDTKGLLTLPIHARYEPVDQKAKFSVRALLSGEGVNVTRCISKVSVQAGERAQQWAYTEATTSGAATKGHCSVIPVGVLQDISVVYFFLMSLLVLGTLIVAFCV